MDSRFNVSSTSPSQIEIGRTYKAPTMQTPYMVMRLQAGEAPIRDNVLAAGFSWMILAGFIFFPGTFTSLANSENLRESKNGEAVQHAVQNIPLLPLAVIFCLVGIFGSCWLWWKWSKNYVWLVERVFSPGLFPSAVGLATTLVNVYTAQHGYWSVTAKITIIIIALYFSATSTLTVIYKFCLIENMKTPHDKELAKHVPQ